MWFFKKNDKKKAESPESQLKTAADYMKKGDDLTRRHEFAEAEKWYLKCLSILEPLSEQYESTYILRELSRTYSMLNVLGRAVTDEKKRAESAGRQLCLTFCRLRDYTTGSLKLSGIRGTS